MSAADTRVVCYFLDVGQGSSQIVCLGDGRAIVIDGGPSAEIPLCLLDRYVSKITALIISHNDADHHRGAAQILDHYEGAVESVYFLEDRPVDRIGLYALAKRLVEAGLTKAFRLECTEGPRVLYEDPASNLSLELFYPDYIDNLTSRETGDPNSTCGVLALFCGSRRVVFPGDSTVEVWRRIHARLGRTVECDILSVPHHGGVIWGKETRGGVDQTADTLSELRWLYSVVLSCDYAVISVGTNNRYGHPKPIVVEALKTAKSSPPAILCTQITNRCCDKPALEILSPGLIPPYGPGGSPSIQERARNKSVACAGTVIAQVGVDEVVVERLEEHRTAVNKLNTSPECHPLCRIKLSC